jgi:hypothetical protein
MKLPKPLNATLTRAQIDRPVATGKVIRRLTSSGGKSGETKGAEADAGETDGSNAPTPAPTRETLTRTNGIDAAKIAAGVPSESSAAH